MNLQPITDNEFESIFIVVKRAIFEHVDAIWGWDDNYQIERLQTSYESNWFHWLYYSNQRIGLICYKRYEDSFHVHFLIVFPEYQRQGYGQQAMNLIHHQAINEQRRSVTLSSFIRNEKALEFYSKLGYQIKNREEHFVSMVWTTAL
ncbi:GNAT family N-acetyltransferase [Vibrio lamellibrachiae]|uniref:GNAT family N-acetyltransferase n=1 Tax=Vibrio lamellibrachiae TaxID=2910253 RepID=UPI003D1385C5